VVLARAIKSKGAKFPLGFKIRSIIRAPVEGLFLFKPIFDNTLLQ
jgi:hypothetical protein